ISSHHAIWSASGLENSLFNFLALAGIWRVILDVRRASFPWSALLFFLLAITRPEGLMYAAIAGAWFLVFCLKDGLGWRPAVKWFFAFWLPYGAFILVRLWYFAMPLPNTYYAKFVTQGNYPQKWYARGWLQIREFSQRLWQGYLLPVYVFGLLGTRGTRGRLALGVVTLFGALLLLPGPDSLRHLWFWPGFPETVTYLQLRIIAITLVGGLLPFFALGRPGGRIRAVLWSFVFLAIGFSVLSNGDWMRGLRWMSLFTCEASILFAVGVDAILSWLAKYEPERKWSPVGWLVTALLIGVQVPPNYAFSHWYSTRWDDFPEMIRSRVKHTNALAAKLFLEEQLRPLDMDMGATMWWSGQYALDMAGLVDVPMALHTYEQRAFIQEYVFEEIKPHVAHVHAAWATGSKFKTYPEWDRDYFQYIGYVNYLQRNTFHDGIWARRDLIMKPRYGGPVNHAVSFQRAFSLVELSVPSPQVCAGCSVFVQSHWATERRRKPEDSVTVTAFMSRGDQLVSWDLPMGYTLLGRSLYPLDWWSPDDSFRGVYSLPIPSDIPSGTWDLGIVVTGSRGLPLGVAKNGRVTGGHVRTEDAQFAQGEVIFEGLIVVVPPTEVVEEANRDRIAALEASRGGDCQSGEDFWRLAWQHLPHDKRYKRIHTPEISSVLAECWAKRALSDPSNEVKHLVRAHKFDHNNPTFLQVSAPIAARLYAAGMDARQAGDADAAYARFSELLKFAPTRSWARKYAEEARDYRLKIKH
ncbi:MAG: hypothetical protein GWP91_05435, partial [Rhodobacterales bacterium]|nr:hypothetical protein [Rhodobacterales bacterium]